jgi:hypothetical protein
MSNKSLWFLAAISLFASTAAADPIRYRAQPDGTRAWLIERGGLFVEEPRKARRPIDLPDWQWAGEQYACAPDIAFGPRGEVVVTSNVLPVLWKIDPATFAVSVHRLQLDADTDKDVGFSGLVYSERNGAYFAVSELHGSLWRIDPLLRRAQKVGLEGYARGACAVSMQRQERKSLFSRLCLHGRNGSSIVHLAADQRSAYLQAAGCSANPYTVIGGMR